MTQRNVVLYLDKDLVEKTRNLGFNLSKTVENHLKQLITLKTTVKTAIFLVARERFELSSAGPKPAMLVRYTTGLSDGILR